MAIDKTKKKMGVGRHASAIKRARQSEKRRLINKACGSRMRTAVKEARATKDDLLVKKAIPLVMRAAQKGVIHKRKASRLASRLARMANAARN